MAIFSPKARRLIDAAMSGLSGSSTEALWRSWVETHPEMRQSGERWEATAKTLPFEVAVAAIGALEHFVSQMAAERCNEDMDEDRFAEMQNDIAHVRSVERFLVQAAAEQRV